MLKNNNPKGITLISLVITVIILLILATVAINLAVDSNGLFGKAGQASNKWNESVATEKSALNGLIGTLDEMTYVHSWTRTGDQVTCSHCGLNYTIGVSTINYVPDEPSENVVLTGEKSGTGADQIIYDVTATDHSATAVTTWVVLGIADEDKDGINERLLITSSEPVGEVNLKGAAAYNYGPDELETICRKLYSSSTGTARSMTIEDVNEALRYPPEGGMYYDGSSYQTTGDFTTKLNELGSVWESIIGSRTPDGTNTKTTLGEYPLDGYAYRVAGDYLVPMTDMSDTTHPASEITNEVNLIFGTSRNYSYWLASRGVAGDGVGGGVCACFGPGRVDVGCASSCYNTFDSDGGEFGESFPVRPVVSLKSEIPTAE